jgi:hypothetical protein
MAECHFQTLTRIGGRIDPKPDMAVRRSSQVLSLEDRLQKFGSLPVSPAQKGMPEAFQRNRHRFTGCIFVHDTSGEPVGALFSTVAGMMLGLPVRFSVGRRAGFQEGVNEVRQHRRFAAQGEPFQGWCRTCGRDAKWHPATAPEPLNPQP